MNLPTKSDSVVILTSAFIVFSLMFVAYINLPTIDDKLANTFSAKDYLWLDVLSTEQYNTSLFELSIGEFQMLIKKEYNYNSYKNSLTNNNAVQNCQYWSYLYYQWFKSNGYEVKYILSEKHLFVIAYVEDGYFVLDGKVWNKVRLI